MTINYTTLLGLAKPVTGTETGQWGDVVNDQITTLLEDALANSSSISVTAGNVTLTTTTGSANQARMSTLIITGTPGTTRNVIAPSQAKIYVVINQSDASVVVKGSATTGVTIGTGQTAQIAWNGSDFVEIGNYVHGNFVVNGNLTVNGNTTLGDAAGDTITVNGATTFANVNPTLSAGTANGVGYLNGSKVLTTGSALTFDGTTLTANALSVTNGVTLSAGTANGVLYLNGSKVATSGSALTFDGTAFSTTGTINAGTAAKAYRVANWTLAGYSGNTLQFGNATTGGEWTDLAWYLAGSEQMRLNSTGLGIGTSSPGAKLDVQASAQYIGNFSSSDVTGGYVTLGRTGATAILGSYSSASGGGSTINADALFFRNSNGIGFGSGGAAVTAFLDSSGNLGLGVTPSAWTTSFSQKALQLSSAASLSGLDAGSGNRQMNLACNVYDFAAPKYVLSDAAAAYRQIGGAHSWCTAPSGTAGNAITFTQAMTLDASGNLGVGTSSPAYKLEVVGATSGVIQIKAGTTTDDSILAFGDSAANVVGRVNYAHSVDAMLFYTNSAERMRLDSSGNLGLGVTPSAWSVSSGYRAMQLMNASLYFRAAAAELYVGNNHYYDGTNWIYLQNLAAAKYEQVNGTHAWFNAPSGTAGNAITFTQAMTLDASGNLSVGITNSQGAKFAVNGGALPSGSSGLTFNAGLSAGRLATGDTNSTTGVINQYLDTTITEISSGTTGAYAAGIVISAGTAAVNANTVRLFTAATERARITSGGDLLVGKTASNITVVGVENLAGGAIFSTCSGSTSATSSFQLYSTGAGAYRFYVGMDGTVNATNTTISAISDRRLKENIRDLDVGLDKIMALKPRKFDWKAGKGKDKKDDRGFIAQEFEQVFPDLIDEWKDPAPEGEEPYKSVRQDLIPVLVKAIQEQQALITQLTARVAQLESK